MEPTMIFCPHCSEKIIDGTLKCPFCEGGIKYTSFNQDLQNADLPRVDPEIIARAQLIMASFCAIAFPLLLIILDLVDLSLEGYVIASLIGAALGYFSPDIITAKKDN